MGKLYTITGGQLRSVIKAAFFAGVDAARVIPAADLWEQSDTRKDIDFHGLLERLEQSAKTITTN